MPGANGATLAIRCPVLVRESRSGAQPERRFVAIDTFAAAAT